MFQFIDCGELEHPCHGLAFTPEGTTVDHEAHYECDLGYILSEDVTRTCEPDGHWSGVAPCCDPSKSALYFANESPCFDIINLRWFDILHISIGLKRCISFTGVSLTVQQQQPLKTLMKSCGISSKSSLFAIVLFQDRQYY